MIARTPDQELSCWLATFDAAMSRCDVDAAMNLFLTDAFWRDLVAFTWNVHTFEGHEAIRDMLGVCLARTAPTLWQAAGPASLDGDIVEATATFETAMARCSAVIRLKQGKCWTLFTLMRELKGFEETSRARRPHGAPLRYQPGRKTWRRQREQDARELGVTRQPYCVIVGAGHRGLSLAARLKQLDVSTLIIDQRERPSDTWRDRHETLSLHSPSWLDAYRTLIDIDVWTDTECLSAKFNETSEEWMLKVVRSGGTVELTPKQLVFAIGLFGAPKAPDIPGMRRFKGEQRHASSPRGNGNYNGRRCVVTGSGRSAHDISAEFWEAGADVTMIQRSPTIVMRHDSLVVSLASLHGDEARARGVTPETTDLLFASVPLRVLLQTQQQLVADINRYVNGYGRQASSSLLVRTTPVSGRSYCAILPAITLTSVPLS
jgi:putative flavoprotein involved in K+ transport